nr:ornithine cyclodeaminase [Acinetobacter sp. Marseille-Q1620]
MNRQEENKQDFVDEEKSKGLLILSQQSLDALPINLEDILVVVQSAFIGLRQGSDNPQKTIIQPVDQRSISYSMVGSDSTSQTVGFKVVYEFDPLRKLDSYNFHSFIFLCDDKTGQPIALMDVVKLGPLRTSATSALMAKAACPDARTALVVGTGIQGQMAFPMLVTAMPHLEKLQIFGHYTEGIQIARDNLRRYFPDRDIEVVSSLEQAANDADIILGVAGASARQQVRHAWMKPNSVAVLVGYGIDADVFQQANCLITTDIEQMKVTCGDLLGTDQLLPEVHAELPDILLGRKTARKTTDDIVFAYNSGMVVTDIALGRYLVEQVQKNPELGQRVKLW